LHVQIEAKLNTSLDTILRYQAALKRDLYRAIAALRAIQGQGRGETVGETNFTNGLLVAVMLGCVAETLGVLVVRQ
jgi:hypothetical protein